LRVLFETIKAGKAQPGDSRVAVAMVPEMRISMDRSNDKAKAQASAFNALQNYYHTFFAEPSTKYGLQSGAITDPTDIRNLTAFFAWSAWCASTLRPGLNYSYTNNWPPPSPWWTTAPLRKRWSGAFYP
jgi:nitric oxide reductase large subunit